MSKKIKKKSWRKLILYFCGLLIVVALGVFGYQWWKYRRAKFMRYPEFGIIIPEPYSIHGIDVSRYQNIIAWEEVKAMQVKDIKLGFAFIKATEGIGSRDPKFKRNWKKSRQAGIVRGAYHFFLATKDGKKQAMNFIKAVDLQPGDLPPVIDVEQTYGVSKVTLRKEVRQWLTTIENHYGVRPIIYTNVDFYKQYLSKGDFENYPLWVAHYYQPDTPRINRSWVFWQHSEEGRVNGIGWKVDFNVFSGDSTAFRSLLVH